MCECKYVGVRSDVRVRVCMHVGWLQEQSKILSSVALQDELALRRGAA